MAFEPIEQTRHQGLLIGDGLAIKDLTALGHMQIACAEITAAAGDFPLVFLKDAQTGQFRLVALMAFDGRRNLFVSDRGWHATYLPRAIQRQPFAWVAGTDGRLGLAIDVDHPRVGDPEGSPLFDPVGAESAFLMARRQSMAQMLDDAQETEAAIAAWAGLGLIQPFPIALLHAGGQQERIEGLYTISGARLSALSDGDALTLYRSGRLAMAYGIQQSACQFNRLQQMQAARAAHDSDFRQFDSVIVGIPD